MSSASHIPVRARPGEECPQAQRFRLLDRLRHGTVDTLTARRDLNIMMPATRINELRALGFRIETRRSNLTDDQGRLHARVAVYALVASGSPKSD